MSGCQMRLLTTSSANTAGWIWNLHPQLSRPGIKPRFRSLMSHVKMVSKETSCTWKHHLLTEPRHSGEPPNTELIGESSQARGSRFQKCPSVAPVNDRPTIRQRD